jgi:hypothetical protein
MKRKFILYAVILSLAIPSINSIKAQSIAINSDGTIAHSSAILDIKSSTKGMLAPRMTTALRTAIGTPAAGLLVYDTDTNSFWFYNGSAWSNLSASATPGWLLTGNSATNTGTHFIGTSDNQPLHFKVNNGWAGEIHPTTGSIFFGLNAGRSNTTGQHNTALGTASLTNNLTGNENVAVGDSSLYSQNGTGTNVAVGTHTLFANTSGIANTAVGPYALWDNVDGSFNTAVGVNSLYHNISGTENTAIGSRALQFAIGSGNTATGASALRFNNNGYGNTANGYQALYSNTGASYNTATGFQALYSNQVGFGNTAYGWQALYSNHASTGDGDANTAIGVKALFTNTHGIGNIAIGYNADVLLDNLSNATVIGFNAAVAASNRMQLGNTITTTISTSGGYTIASDGRFKENLQVDVKGLDFIMKLRPVTYNFNYDRYDQFIRPDNKVPANDSNQSEESIAMLQKKREEKSEYQRQLIMRSSKRETGFVAQEVEKAVKESGYTGFNGVYAPTNDKDNYSLDYSKLVVPLVKAIQEQQAMIKTQQQQIDLLMKRIEALEKK